MHNTSNQEAMTNLVNTYGGTDVLCAISKKLVSQYNQRPFTKLEELVFENMQDNCDNIYPSQFLVNSLIKNSSLEEVLRSLANSLIQQRNENKKPLDFYEQRLLEDVDFITNTKKYLPSLSLHKDVVEYFQEYDDKGNNFYFFDITLKSKIVADKKLWNIAAISRNEAIAIALTIIEKDHMRGYHQVHSVDFHPEKIDVNNLVEYIHENFRNLDEYKNATKRLVNQQSR